MIEIMGNEYQEMQRNRQDLEIQSYDLETFWQWEAKIQEQEVDYYERLLRELKDTIDAEIDEHFEQANLEDVESNIPKKLLTPDQKKAKAIMAEVDAKYAEKKKFLVMGYERAKSEEQLHYKQRDYRKYERMFELYAYPINLAKFDEEDTQSVIAAANESAEIAMSKV